jgi:hypothetical protein
MSRFSNGSDYRALARKPFTSNIRSLNTGRHHPEPKFHNRNDGLLCCVYLLKARTELWPTATSATKARWSDASQELRSTKLRSRAPAGQQ